MGRTYLCQDRWRFPASEDVFYLLLFHLSPKEVALCPHHHPPDVGLSVICFIIFSRITQIHYRVLEQFKILTGVKTIFFRYNTIPQVFANITDDII